MAGEGGLTLEQAIKNKYCLRDQEEEPFDEYGRRINEIALGYRPGSRPVDSLTSVVLENMGVSRVGKILELSELCPRLEQLHLSSNQIATHEDVLKILSSLPRLSFLNLCHNPLDSSTFLFNEASSCNSLSTLVLNNTGIAWEALETCLEGIPRLQELYLSMNNYTNISFTDSFQHATLKQLHLNHNQITTWADLVKLSCAFPNLKILSASDNPIGDSEHVNSDIFPELETLCLNNCAFSSWKSVEYLHFLCKLKELSVMNIPLGKDLEIKKRRHAVIARLPKIHKLNKSIVTEEEREIAERWLIRAVRESPDPPLVLQDLIKKHGDLKPLIDIDIGVGDKEKVALEFHFDDEEREVETYKVCVKQTVSQLKRWVAKNLVKMPPSTFDLWYLDKGSQYGKERMIYNTRSLHCYKYISDGDEIHIVMKYLS